MPEQNEENIGRATVIRQVRCRIHDAEYLEATPERLSDNDVAQLVNKIMIVCEDVETGEIGGGTLSAEDIASIAGIDRLMTPREMMEFSDRLRNFEGEFIMPIPEEGLLPLDESFIEVPVENTTPVPTAPPAPVFPPLSPEEEETATDDTPVPSWMQAAQDRADAVLKPSLGEKFAQRRKQIRGE
jgi:hypothetical protein